MPTNIISISGDGLAQLLDAGWTDCTGNRQHRVEGGSNRAIKLGSIFSYLFVQSRLKEEFVKINSFLHSGQVRAYTCRGKCGEMWLTFITIGWACILMNQHEWRILYRFHQQRLKIVTGKFSSKLTRKSSLLGGWMDGFFQLVCRSFFPAVSRHHRSPGLSASDPSGAGIDSTKFYCLNPRFWVKEQIDSHKINFYHRPVHRPQKVITFRWFSDCVSPLGRPLNSDSWINI